jgi:hypothetical protein
VTSTHALASSRINGTPAHPVEFAPGKPTVSETSDAVATSEASPTAEYHEMASSTNRSCAPAPRAAATASTSSTDK